jgi:hypothetical protein
MESGVRQLTEQDISTLSTTKQVEYGALGMTPDGRRFRYVQFPGTSTIAPGLLLVCAAVKANAAGLAITAAGTAAQTTASLKAGSTFLSITNSSTAVTQDEFAEGYMQVNQTSGTSEGPILYKIRGNDAAAGSGSPNFNIYLNQEEPLRNAETLVAGTDTVTLTQSPYLAPTASTTQALPVGVTIIQVPNSATVTNYGWVQTGGLVLVNATSGTKGYPATQDVATNAGYFANTGTGAAETVPQLGVFKESASSSIAPVFLTLD